MRFVTKFTGNRLTDPKMEAYALEIRPGNLSLFGSGHGLYGDETEQEVVVTRNAPGTGDQYPEDGAVGFHLPAGGGFFSLMPGETRALRDFLTDVLDQMTDARGS